MMKQRWCRLIVLAQMCLLGAGVAKAAICHTPPPAIENIEAIRYRIDKASSINDAKLKAKNEALVKPLEDYLKTVSGNADQYIAYRDKQAALCALQWLQSWADGHAMLGQMSSNQAEYERKWMLAGLALAYLKVKPEATDVHRQTIGPWLAQLADQSLAFFADTRKHKRNNHYYWVGLGIGAVATATDSQKYWQQAHQIFNDAMADVLPDGTLPLELARQGKALSYHNYALQPLILLAELAALHHEDWYGKQGGPLQLLIDKTLLGIKQPEIFKALTGYEQEVPKGNNLGWLVFYSRRFPGRVSNDFLPAGTHIVYPRLGGDLTVLAPYWQK